MGTSIGYVRVSKYDQNLDLQIDALQKEGIEKKIIFKDKSSGAKANRPGLDACLAALAPGDTLVVWRLDRLGRSMSHLVNLVKELKEREIGFKSLCDGAIDTTTASGEFLFNVIAALTQLERGILIERTKAGLEAARARGKVGGRPRVTVSDPRVKTAKLMHQDKSISIDEICESLEISRATLYRFLKIGVR